MTSGVLTSYLAQPHSPNGADPPLNEEHLVFTQRRHNRIPNVYFADPINFDLTKFSRYQNLCAVYEYIKQNGGQAAGVDGLRFSDISKPERNTIINQISPELLEGTFRPYLTREVTVRKRHGGIRQLAIPIIFDRMVIKALLLCLNSFWRRQLPNYGRDVWKIYAIMQQAIRREQKYVLAIDDIRACYPSASIDYVIQYQRQYIQQPELICLIERIIRGHHGLNHPTGLEQGSPYSPVAMESFLHNRLDTVIEMRYPGLTQLRYVDNTTYLCSNSSEGEQILHTANEILREVQLSLKGEDGPPQDIRNPNHNRSLLGLIPRWESGQIELSIPESAFQDLEAGLTMTNNNPKTPYVIQRTMLGWINAVGPALTNTKARSVVDRVNNMALQKGIREFSIQELLKTAKEARKRWLKLTRRYS